jgi:hypothetical protein
MFNIKKKHFKSLSLQPPNFSTRDPTKTHYTNTLNTTQKTKQNITSNFFTPTNNNNLRKLQPILITNINNYKKNDKLDNSIEYFKQTFLEDNIRPFEEKIFENRTNNLKNKLNNRMTCFSFYNDSFKKFEEKLSKSKDKNDIKFPSEISIKDAQRGANRKRKYHSNNNSIIFKKINFEQQDNDYELPILFTHGESKVVIRDAKNIPYLNTKVEGGHKIDLRVREQINKNLFNKKFNQLKLEKPKINIKKMKGILKGRSDSENKLKLYTDQLKHEMENQHETKNREIENEMIITKRAKNAALPEVFQINGGLTFPYILGDTELICSIYNQNLVKLKKYLSTKAKEKFY